jgi:glycerophosphoryl diester phosphodiesterase
MEASRGTIARVGGVVSANRVTRPLVIAHRGASGHKPENTLPAYRLAIDQRADMIEIDLHVTRDGVIVITHDEDLVGLGGTGEIADHSADEIRALDAGEGERVPTLDEVLDGFGREIPFNLELKRSKEGPYPGLEAAVLEALHARELVPSMLFSSFFDPVLKELREQSEQARIGFLVSPRFPHKSIERAKAVGAEALHPEVRLVDQALVDAAHAAGLSVNVYTVDDVELMKRLIDLGVDGLFTNFPDRMRSLLDS